MAPTPVLESKPASLEFSGGKSADIETVRRTHQIVVKASQEKKSNLTVYRVRKDESVQMAFCFELKNKKYFPLVEKDLTTQQVNIKVQSQSDPKNLSEPFLFRWANYKGPYGSLCSVAEPSQYLHVSENQVTLSPNPDLGFKVHFLPSNNLPAGMSGERGYYGQGRGSMPSKAPRQKVRRRRRRKCCMKKK